MLHKYGQKFCAIALKKNACHNMNENSVKNVISNGGECIIAGIFRITENMKKLPEKSGSFRL